MNKLLATEWMKVRKYRTFWIMIGMFLLLLPLWNYGINSGVLQIFGKTGIDVISKAYSFANVWDNLGFWTSIFVVFISILTIIITTNEYMYRTNRQNIIDGLSRLQYYHAKWLVVFSLTVFTTLYVFIVGTIFGAVNDSFSNFPGNINGLFYVFVLAFNYYAFAMLIGFFFKRSGIAIGIFFLYSMIIESMLKGIMNFRNSLDLGNYLPLQASDELLPFPIVEFIKSMTQLEKAPALTGYVIASFAWIIIYYIIGRLRLVKSDW